MSVCPCDILSQGGRKCNNDFAPADTNLRPQLFTRLTTNRHCPLSFTRLKWESASVKTDAKNSGITTVQGQIFGLDAHFYALKVKFDFDGFDFFDCVGGGDFFS